MADRFDWWCETVAQDTAPTRISSPFQADFQATVALVQLGEVQLSSLSFPRLRSERTAALIRASDPERFELALITGSGMWLSQHGREALLDAGDLLLYETSRPFDSRALGQRDASARALILHIPRDRLAFAGQAMKSLLARRIPAAEGLTAVLANHLSSVHAAGPNVSDSERELFGRIALDLVSATAAALAGAETRLEPEARTTALQAQINRFIEHHLADRELTAERIAAAFHISTSHLYRIYRPNEMTVSAWIRHRRMERCRSDLADPRLSGEPVHQIAARHGLGGPSEFSRSFRAYYGMTPLEFRRAALQTR